MVRLRSYCHGGLACDPVAFAFADGAKHFSHKRPGTNSKALATCKSAFYLKMADALRRSKVVERARPLQDALEVQLRHTNVLFHIVIALERVSRYWRCFVRSCIHERACHAIARSHSMTSDIGFGIVQAWEFAAKEAEEEAVAKAEKRAAPAASQALQVRAANKRAIARRKEVRVQEICNVEFGACGRRSHRTSI